MRSTAKTGPYTVFIVGAHSTAVRRVQVTPRRVRLAVGLAAATALAVAAMVAHSASSVANGREEAALRRENAQLRAELQAVQERVAHIAATLDRVDGLDARLRADTRALQPAAQATAPAEAGANAAGAGTGARSAGAAATDARSVRLLPSHGAPPAPAGPSTSRATPAAGDRDAAAAFAALEGAAARQEGDLRAAQAYFSEQRALLATVPAAWPARGLVTSDFGDRLDPYTADRMMHRGLDIAAAPGTSIYAPSDAVVAFAGTENGYGKVLILDHGNGVNTRYGHLSRIFVKVGERVANGERVATVGSTGRSTGPHLHYEVRVDGVAENPRKFILR